MTGRGWIGVDLDGTLAEYHGWDGGGIGVPVPAMVERVRTWLAEGKDVRIFTARVCWRKRPAELAAHVFEIQDWCREHLGQVLPITAQKDFDMVELWDDRCVQIIPNTGLTVTEYYTETRA